MKMKGQTPSLFVLGAAGYAALELLWRGRTHWTMALTGGTVLVGLAHLRRHLGAAAPFLRCLSGAACITSAEYVVGCTVNRHLHLRVWDYSHEFGNIQGQICPKYAALWLLLATPVMLFPCTDPPGHTERVSATLPSGAFPAPTLRGR